MQFSTVLFIFSAGLSAASPLQERQLPICSNALQTPKCCGVSLEGIANMDCDSRESSPKLIFRLRLLICVYDSFLNPIFH